MKATYALVIMLATTMSGRAVNLKTILKNPFVQNYQEVITKEHSCKNDAILEIEHEVGNITITSWKQSKIIVEATKTGAQEAVKQTKIQISQHNDKISINALSSDDVQIDYHILVPESAVLSCISTQIGSIKIKHIKGPITVSTQQGDIEIINAEKTVIAQNSKGNVVIRQTQLPTQSAIIVDSISGNVELSLASGINAHLALHTVKGTISSEQHITLNEAFTKLDVSTWQHLSRNIQAKLGSGGAPITVKISQYGNIALTEY